MSNRRQVGDGAEIDGDYATAPGASYCPDMGDLDTALDEVREIARLSDEAAIAALEVWLERQSRRDDGIRLASEMFRVCLIQIMESKTPKREAWIWAYVAGMECTLGQEMKHLAARFGITKQAISKAVNDRVDRFGLNRNRNLRSDELRRTLRAAQLKRTGHSSENDGRCNGRMKVLQSVESVLLRFMAWARANRARETITSWPTSRLRHIQQTIAPVVQFNQAITLILEGRK